jgi:hypothetical protein
VSGYDKLLAQAVKSKGNLEPFLQQLQKYDNRDIVKWRDSIKLSEDIAIKVLKSGLMRTKSRANIRKSIKIFLDPSAGTISHGRSINRDEAKACGLKIEGLDVNSSPWHAIYELYSRTEMFVSSSAAAKTVESKDDAFFVSPE